MWLRYFLCESTSEVKKKNWTKIFPIFYIVVIYVNILTQSSNRDRANESIQLMGGRIDELGNRILGIDDGVSKLVHHRVTWYWYWLTVLVHDAIYFLWYKFFLTLGFSDVHQILYRDYSGICICKQGGWRKVSFFWLG